MVILARNSSRVPAWCLMPFAVLIGQQRLVGLQSAQPGRIRPTS
jgi:hypothetical protein